METHADPEKPDDRAELQPVPRWNVPDGWQGRVRTMVARLRANRDDRSDLVRVARERLESGALRTPDVLAETARRMLDVD